MSGVGAPEPGNRAPAPDRLKVVQEFINSIDIEEGVEQLETPAQLRTWLANHGLPNPGNLRLTSKDVERARRFRELLRSLAASNNGIRPSSTLHKALNRGHETDPIRTVRGAGYALDDRFGKAS